LNEKRVTDLINLHILDKTERVFPEETILLRAGLNFMRRVTAVSNQAVAQYDKHPNLRAVLDLFCRNRDLVHFSIVCMVNGGYAETKILSRVALENFLLIRLFNLQPSLAEDWFSDPDGFRKKWRAEKIRKAVFKDIPKRIDSYSQFYWLLCDYTHPSFRGWIELMKKKENGIYIGYCPAFNPDYASECMGFVCWIIIQSLKGYLDAFKEWLTKGLVLEANRLMPKIHEIVTRHFEVRVYDKRKIK
jgi:hypothetical protein